MSRLVSLPGEILQHILSHISDPSQLAKCCLVSHKLWEIAAPLLYADIDLALDDSGPDCMERQGILLEIIAAHPTLASLIHSFKNCPKNRERPYSQMLGDGSDTCEVETLIAAAKNMTSLRRVYLRANALASYVLQSLGSYPQLTELSVFGLGPEHHIWPSMSTSLTSLTWKLPGTFHVPAHSTRTTILLTLLAVVEATCPLLKSLDIGYVNGPSNTPVKALIRAPEIAEINMISGGSLKSLHHFGFRHDLYKMYCWPDYQLLHKFVQRHQNSILSFSISIGFEHTLEELDFVLGLCDSLPKLKEIAFTTGRKWPIDSPTKMSPTCFISALVTKLTGQGRWIESFTLADMASPISRQIFRIFGSWTGLRYLRLGDYNVDKERSMRKESFDFRPWVRDLKEFVLELPLSLEEFYLNVKGEYEYFSSDKDTEFSAVWELGEPMFTHLQRLRACDICAWPLSYYRGYIDNIPSQAIHWRRLPFNADLDVENESCSTSHIERGNRVKTLWTSTMCNPKSSITQPCRVPEILHYSHTLELKEGQGEFEGEDASGIWLDGDLAGIKARHTSQYRDDYARPWPFRRNDLQAYPWV